MYFSSHVCLLLWYHHSSSTWPEYSALLLKQAVSSRPTWLQNTQNLSVSILSTRLRHKAT